MVMMDWLDFLNVPFGYILQFCYQFLHNYGLAIIVFTLLMKLILVPLGVKQKKSMVKQLVLQPKEAVIRRKYKDDKEKMNQAVMELYQSEGFNPMGGCLPLLIQFPIIISLYNVINHPLTYMMQLKNLPEIMKVLNYTPPSGGYFEINLAQQMSANYDKIANLVNYQPIIDFNFLGINLGGTPSYTVPSVLWLIPVFAGVTALISGIYSQKNMPSAGGQAAQSTKMMMYVMPVMSLFICFSVPAGVGLYWGMSSLFAIFQEMALNAVYKPQQMVAKAKEEAALAEADAKKKKKKPKVDENGELIRKVSDDQNKKKAPVEKAPAEKAPDSSIILEELMDKKKPISYKFEDDPVIIAKIKAYNASLAAGEDPTLDLTSEEESTEEAEAVEERKDSADD